MSSLEDLSRLLEAVVKEADGDKALRAITQSALSLTKSQYAMIAMLDETGGMLQIRYGAGQGFNTAEVSSVPVDIAKENGIVGYVAATGSTFQSGNVDKEPHYLRLFKTTQSEIAVPIYDGDERVRAVLNLETDRKNAYSPGDQEMALCLANIASMVMAQIDHRDREEALIQIGSALDSSLTEESLIERVIGVAETVLRFEACSIFLHDRVSDTFVLRGTIGTLKPQVGKISYSPGEGFTGWVCKHGEPILLDNPQVDGRWKGKFVEIPNDEICSFLAVPIISRTGPIGAIRALRRKSSNQFLDNRFRPTDLRLFQAIAEQVASGLENTRNVTRLVRDQRMIAWGELSAKSSHMIGNRVFALKGDVNELGYLVSSPNPSQEELKELQESLVTNVMRIEEILQDFRDFVTATQLDLSPEDLKQIVLETVNEVFPKRSAVKLELDLHDVPILNVDSRRIRRAVSELIENSLNHVEKGVLTVRTKLAPQGTYGSRLSRQMDCVEISVQDDGPGVGEDRKSLIFQPFHSGRVKGMGLGLSIVKGIIDAHGGEVFEAGNEGSGANFVMLLPLTE